VGILSSITSWAGRQVGAAVAPVTQAQLFSLLGPPRGQLDPSQDHILSDVFSPPYRGPGELDNYGCETREMRWRYRAQHRESPVLRAALDGKANDISCLEPTVLSADKDDALSNQAAEFVKWTVSMAPGGWAGAIDTMYRAGSIDGWSVAEKKLKETWWKGRRVWGLAHLRGLDTVHMRLQLDVYRNVVGVVNVLRGLEYYDPGQVVLYTHNGMYSNPFGQSDVRSVTKASSMIEDVYRVWYVALKVYGLPYMHGKVNQHTNRKQMEAALTALREGGYVVTGKDDEINVLNMASAASISGFEPLLRAQREDTFYGVRSAALPFLEGQGSSGAHGDTEVEQGTSDAGEKRHAHNIADVFNRQLVPWLVGPNFELDESRMPHVKFGGTNWKQIKEIVSIIRDAKETGIEVSAEFAHDVSSMPAPRDEKDRLVSAQEKQQQAQQAQQAAQQPPAPTAPAPDAVPPAMLSEATPPAAPSSPFAPTDVARLGDYFEANQHGHFSGDLHEQFGLTVPQFANQTGMKRKQVKRDGKPAWVWAPAKGSDGGAKTFSADGGAEVDAAQVDRVIGELLKELAV
jgi:hypothetical protein